MITTFSVVLLALLALTYVSTILATASGLQRVLKANSPSMTVLPTVSVVVAARNEQDGIEDCVRSILSNDYPGQRLQLVVVDDRSDDATLEILKRVSAGRPAGESELIVLERDTADTGKGAALEEGIRVATGDVILTTDADCFVPKSWIRSMVGYLGDDTGFVAGTVVNRWRPGLWFQLESLEFLSLVGFGAGTIGIGTPTICNSANAAYRKRLYQQWRSKERLSPAPASDELIMHYIHRETPYRVVFNASPEAVVETNGATSIRDFWSQRLRWVSSVPHFPWSVRAMSLTIFAFFSNVAVVAAASVMLEPSLLIVGVAAMVMKVLADTAVLLPLCRQLQRTFPVGMFIMAELLHIPYVLVTAPVGLLVRHSWKGQRVAASRQTGASRRTAPASTIVE